MPDPTTAGATATPTWSSRPPVFRRSDPVAGLLLVLAGLAAGVSLPLRWLADDDGTGLDLVRRGFRGLGDVVDTGLWQPLAIVLGGALLLLLGLLVLLPARTHRLRGAAALVVSGLVAWAVLVPLVAAGLDLGFFDTGFWCAIAVAVLGLLGALKALLTPPRTA
ncbi:hypothetical protein DQ237_17815 [Blastococcus sp. TF02-8]|nr:hypothetical protein DQ237_17815 [Blastococcus sp. TF02-8]